MIALVPIIRFPISDFPCFVFEAGCDFHYSFSICLLARGYSSVGPLARPQACVAENWFGHTLTHARCYSVQLQQCSCALPPRPGLHSCIVGVALNSVVRVCAFGRTSAQRRKPVAEPVAQLVNTHVQAKSSKMNNEKRKDCFNKEKQKTKFGKRMMETSPKMEK